MTAADRVLVPLEDMAGALEQLRVPGLRRFLRDRFLDPAGVTTARVELAWAFMLATQPGLRFGGQGQPDFVLEGGDTEIWLEITRVDLESFDRFKEAVVAHLAKENLKVVPTFRVVDWPAKVPERNSLISRIEAGARAALAAGHMVSVSLPEIAAQCSVSLDAMDDSLPGSSPVWHSSIAPSSEYQQRVERDIREAISDKAAQSRRGSWTNTLLVIDISTARLLWMLGWDDMAKWAGAIAIDWHENPFLAIALTFSDWYTHVPVGFMRIRPELPDDVRTFLTSLGAKIPGLVPA